MSDINGLDALGVIFVAILAAIFIVWILRSMRYQFTTGQLVFLVLFCVLLGVLLESWFRNTRELVLTIIAMAVLMIGWVAFKLRRLTRRGPAAVMALMVAVLILSNPVLAYQAPMHQDLLDSSISCTNEDGRTYIAVLFGSHDVNGILLSQWMRDGIYDTDRLDLARDHYYDPTTGAGLTGLSSAELADQLYGNAVDAWKSGDAAAGSYYLGRSAHMVMDSTIPHHSHLDPFNGHSGYEQWLADHKDLYVASSGGFYGSSSNASGLVRANALVAYSLYDMVVDSNCSDSNNATVAAIIEPRAIRSTAALLDMFVNDVQGVEPVLEVKDSTFSSVTLTWTPSADLDFLSYEVYVSEPGKKVDLSKDPVAFALGNRDQNSVQVVGLTEYAQYQFQVVTSTSTAPLESQVVSKWVGFSFMIVVGAILLVALLAVAAYILQGERPGINKKRRN